MRHTFHPILIILAVLTFSGHMLAAKSAPQTGDPKTVQIKTIPHTEGKLWVNTASEDASSLRIELPYAVLLPAYGVAAVITERDRSTLFAVKGLTRVLLKKPDTEILNQFVLPEGFQAVIAPGKVNEKAGKLLLGKLVKEFQMSRIPAKFYDDAWTIAQTERDQQSEDTLRAKHKERVLARGLTHAPVTGDTFLRKTASSLTLDPKKRASRAASRAQKFLDDAEYLFLIGNNGEAEKRLEAFADTYEASEAADFALMSWLQVHRFIDPSHALHPMIARLREIHPSLAYARAALADMYRAGGELLDSYLDSYQKIFFAARADSSLGSDALRALLQEEHFLLTRLVEVKREFFTEKFFVLLADTEEELLRTFSEGPEKTEERQSLIADKIRLLDLLQEEFFADRLTLQVSRAISFRLINDLHNLLPTEGKEIAVVQLFREELKTFADFWGYLNASQFAESLAHGRTHRERFSAYLAEADERLTIEWLTKQIAGGGVKIPGEETAAIHAQIEKDFLSIGAKNIQIGASSAGEKFVPIQSVQVANVNVSGRYDYEQKLLSEIMANGKPVFQGAVAIEKLTSLLKVTLNPPPSSGAAPEKFAPEVIETKAEKLARIAVMQRLTEKGMTVSLEQILISEKGLKGPILFRAELLALPLRSEILFSVDYDFAKDAITKVTVTTPLGDRELDMAKFTADEIFQAVEMLYDEAVLEKLEKEVKE